jgi:type IV pilus assembly protein PilA
MKKISQSARKGFTLVEIMIVVVIIGLLAAMAVPAFNKVRQTAISKAVTNDLRQIAAAADQYFLENPSANSITLQVIQSDYVKSLKFTKASGGQADITPTTIERSTTELTGTWGTADTEKVTFSR